MMALKILGVGSPFGDDTAGWQVVQSLHSCPGVVIEQQDRPGLGLIELMQGAEEVWIVDAMVSGGVPGTIHTLASDMFDDEDLYFSSHEMGVIQALQLAKALDMLPAQVTVYAIEINPEELSSQVAVAIDRLAGLLNARLLQRFQQPES